MSLVQSIKQEVVVDSQFFFYGRLLSYWIDTEGKKLREKDIEYILGDVLLPKFSQSLSESSMQSLFFCYRSVFQSTLFFPYLAEKECSETLKACLMHSASQLLTMFDTTVSISLQTLHLHLLTYLMQHPVPCMIESAFPALCLHNALQLLPSLPDDPRYITNVLQLIRVCHSNSSFTIDNISDFQLIVNCVMVRQRPLSVANEALSTMRVILKSYISPHLQTVLYHYLLWSFTTLSRIEQPLTYDQYTHSIEVIRVLFLTQSYLDNSKLL